MMKTTWLVIIFISFYCCATKGQQCNAPRFSCQYNNPCDPLCFPGHHLYPGSSSRKYVECDDGECTEQVCPRRSNWNQANLRCEGGNGLEVRCSFGKFDCESRNPCSPTLCESDIEKYPGSSPRRYVSCTDGCSREQCPRRQVWDQEKQRCVRKPTPCPEGQTYDEDTSQCTPEVDWTECWEEVTVNDIPADCHTAAEGDTNIYDTRDIPTIYDRFDARRHCGARSESRYLYTKPVYSSIDNWRLVASCINDHGVCLQTSFSDNFGQFFLRIDLTLDDGVVNIPANEMVYDEDCSGEGLISDWVWNVSTYNVEECVIAGGTHIYGRLATLEASCYPNIECTLPTEDQTVYRKKAECIFT